MRDLFAVLLKHEHVDPGSAGILSDVEQARLARLVSPEKRTALLRSLLAIRQCLSDRLSATADRLVITHDDAGVPTLPDYPSLSLSISRTRDLTAIALSEGRNVGIDIERERPAGWRAMLSMISSDEEAKLLQSLSGNYTDPLPFFRAWTVKEAVMKAAGTGFRFGAKRVSVPETLLTRQNATADIEIDGAVYPIETGHFEHHVFAVALCVG